MGYCTNYSIEADKFPSKFPKIKPVSCHCGCKCKTPYCPECGCVTGIRKFDGWESIISSYVGFDPFCDEVKWYRHRRDMLRVSSDYPDTLFTLSGEGEEAGDVWKEYYLGGKYQEAKGEISYPEFDLDKLQSN